ncbi:MAG: antiviral reverse transcriptase Drt3b [Bacteroidia bacterium]
MGRYKINKNDKSRILLTELLPYEVPILFSNEGLYKFYQEKEKSNPPQLVTKLLDVKDSDFKIPFSYDIKKSTESKRTLSLIHPAIQLKFIPFYQKYDALIIHLCSRSPISLRFPSKVATHFYFKNNQLNNSDKESSIEIEQSGFEKEQIFSSSYFAYKKYPLLFKFYDSYEFLRLEKKFKHLLQFDISKCFESIYTHTISWAVKDKMFAKANTNNKSFEADFDKLMQKSNYNETNGILIGSEVSRIFAEIILQKIDLETIEKLKQKNLHFGADYAVRRYVDDYFVFTNDEKAGKEILKEFQSELAKFKLHINASKTETSKTPFISGITIGRTELQKLLDDFFEKFIHYEEYEVPATDGSGSEVKTRLEFKVTRNNNTTANWIVRDIKSIIKKHNIEYESITGLTFSRFKTILYKIYRNYETSELTEKKKENLTNFLLITFDVMFFLYSMDYRVRATYIMTQIIISTNRFIAKCGDEVKHSISKKIYDETVYLIKNIKQDNSHRNVELLNLLISLKDLGDDYLLQADALIDLLDIENQIEHFTYFHLTIILYYIQDNVQYEHIKKKIEQRIIFIINDDPNPFHKTELTCLFFDTISCPYLCRLTKENLVEVAFKKIDNTAPLVSDRNRVINYIAARNWFIDWSKDIELDSVLLKKELRTPY